MKNAERLALAGAEGVIYIERNRRNVLETIGLVVCKVMQNTNRRPPYVLIGWHDYHLLRNEIGAPWTADGPSIVATPAGGVRLLVDPSVETGVRALPEIGDHLTFIQNSSLLKAR